MSKHLIEGFITYKKYEWQEQPSISFSTYDPAKYGMSDTVVIRDHSFEVEVPDDFDPRPEQIKNLEAEKNKLKNEFQARVIEIEKQINKLLALEMS